MSEVPPPVFQCSKCPGFISAAPIVITICRVRGLERLMSFIHCQRCGRKTRLDMALSMKHMGEELS